jgi:ATP-dependent helicase HrpB
MNDLPILELRETIVGALRKDKCLIVRAPTGSGKSTQVPQMLLDADICAGRILVLQPRRLAARMLAERIAEERGCELGGKIGFQTRFESQVSDQTRICFITEGILPRLLLHQRDLSDVSAIIFDEFHERSLACDIGLALALDLQRQRRPDLKLIVMSATIDVEPLKAYLRETAVIDAAGRLFPIDLRYSAAPSTVPVWERAATAVRELIREGAAGDVVVFMPGVYEIRRTVETIERSVHGEPLTVLPLYGDLPAQRQHQVMQPLDRRKIIVATNIAETSLTIPGVRHVIDSGLARVNRYDSGRGFNTLYIEPISTDSADQRAGRAGREDAGICIRLWSQAQQGGRSRRTTPEVLRVDLAETVLSLHQLDYASPELFPWFEKPTETALQAGQELLLLLGALDADGHITETGQLMAGLPMHPRLARLLLEAGKRGAARLATFAAALLSERSALAGKPDYPEEAHRHEIASDFYGQYLLLEKISKSDFDPQVCTRYAVNASAGRAILRTQALYLTYCRRLGFHTRDSESAPQALALALLLAYPDHLAVRQDRGTLLCRLRDNRRGELAKASLARSADLLVTADIREIRNSAHELKTLLTLATEIRQEWLHEFFADQWTSEASLAWNPSTQAVESRSRTWCLGVLLEEKNGAPADPLQVASLLAETIIQKELKIATWDQGVEDWINRIRWVAGQFPEHNLPAFTEEERRLVVHALCEGESRYDRVKNKPVLPLLQELLTYEQSRFVESMAPAVIIMPTGRKMRVEYQPGAAPRGRARIQDLYDLKATPRVAGGRAGVLIEVLAPNNRPVQITEDLARFWEVHYPEVKKALSRRYPRHEWR